MRGHVEACAMCVWNVDLFAGVCVRAQRGGECVMVPDYLVLLCAAVCCSALQCVAGTQYGVLCDFVEFYRPKTQNKTGVRCSVLQCAVACCSMLQSAVVFCSMLQCATVCCSVLQCVAVCSSARLSLL